MNTAGILSKGGGQGMLRGGVHEVGGEWAGSDFFVLTKERESQRGGENR